ncbi:MAG TPA: hypothetical protein VMB49_22655 [Acidobacteriaceae bacterium]|nr:hypothetical protein [Acidobacteriaceae bacterium]
MKISAPGLLIACLAALSAPNGICQENPQSDRPYLNHTESPRLYFTVPGTDSTGRVQLIASKAERDLGPQFNLTSANTATVLELRGDVEVRMCSPGAHGCDTGSVVLHADSVDYDERTGELNALGHVHIGPYQSR